METILTTFKSSVRVNLEYRAVCLADSEEELTGVNSLQGFPETSTKVPAFAPPPTTTPEKT